MMQKWDFLDNMYVQRFNWVDVVRRIYTEVFVYSLLCGLLFCKRLFPSLIESQWWIMIQKSDYYFNKSASDEYQMYSRPNNNIRSTY